MGVLIDPVDGTTDVEPLPCVQTAPVRPLRPEAWSVISGAAIEVAAKCAVTGVTTSDQQWGRVGVAVKLASTSSETFGTVTVRFWVMMVDFRDPSSPVYTDLTALVEQYEGVAPWSYGGTQADCGPWLPQPTGGYKRVNPGRRDPIEWGGGS